MYVGHMPCLTLNIRTAMFTFHGKMSISQRRGAMKLAPNHSIKQGL